eukprot:TRINITY_DN27772_c0_g1_i1.p2 TRINITY_DN27772_c0_g1~~TRINITY_DN27772_c0_g1_i1.p2  ORF type:complete len:393 (-),score=60.28 TRINITY_DN27772_c0_g1_i1:1192-2370(-)
MATPIYLDFNASTPLCPAAIEAVKQYFDGWPHGNPSSGHPHGKAAKALVDSSRAAVAEMIACPPADLFFTSGGTESNNWAIIGAALGMKTESGRKEIVTTQVEHPAVIEVCKYLEEQHGFEVKYLAPENSGIVPIAVFQAAITENTALVTVMHANNETGSLQPISEIAKLAKKHGAVMHTDAAQSIGKVPVSVELLGVDLLSVCSHKFYGPKGIGALYVRPGTPLQRLMFGAGHESGKRPGTENVMGMVALAAAARDVTRTGAATAEHMLKMRDRLHNGLIAELGAENVVLNGHPTERLPNTLNVSLRASVDQPFAKSNILLWQIENQVAASAGSACHAGHITTSPVLKAMGVPIELAHSAIRLSTGKSTTEVEIDQAVSVIVDAVRHPKTP